MEQSSVTHAKVRLSIYIFSFNRGAFLKNAIDSCLQYASAAKIFVVDDNSTDLTTQAYLMQLPCEVTLMQPKKQGKGRHGGLYNNMQWAFEHADSEWILFIQDDMQLVRWLDQDDFIYIEQFFEKFSDQAFLNPVFLKGQRYKRDQRITRVYDEFPAYYRDYPEKHNSRGLSYSDVVIGHVERLKNANWKFADNEQHIATDAERLFGKMGFMAHPFVMFLPQVPVYRGKQKTRAVALAEKWSGQQPKFFEMQSKEYWLKFKSRSLSELPVAEQYLQCIDKKINMPYHYSCVNAYWYLRICHKLSLWFTQ